MVYSVSDGIVTIYLNGNANVTTILSGQFVANIPDGSYNLTIVAIDQVENIGFYTVLGTIDTTPPTVTIASPTSPTYTSNLINVSLSGNVVVFQSFLDKLIKTPACLKASDSI